MDLATRTQAQALQVDRELQMFYEEYSGNVPQELQWIFDTSIDTHGKTSTTTIQQWLNTWTPIVAAAVKDNGAPEGHPSNLEKYPYSTALETG